MIVSANNIKRLTL